MAIHDQMATSLLQILTILRLSHPMVDNSFTSSFRNTVNVLKESTNEMTAKMNTLMIIR